MGLVAVKYLLLVVLLRVGLGLGLILPTGPASLSSVPYIKVLPDNSKSSVDAYINKSIEENKVFVFSKSYCTYSMKVKAALSKFGIPYKTADVDVSNVSF